MQHAEASWKRPAAAAAALLVLSLTIAGDAGAQALAGSIGSSAQWGSGWMDLAAPVDLQRGERLRIHLGGSAEKVVVRLLPKGASPETDTGIVGGAINVPKGRVIEVTLSEPRRQIAQIAAHGGPNPWGKYPLGDGNGPATIVSVERLKP